MRRALLVLAMVASNAHAGAPLTLADAQQEARAHAPERQSADAAVHAAEIRAAAAGRRLTHDPIAIGRYQQVTPGQDADDRAYGGGLEWTIDVSRAPGARGDAARAAVTAATQDRAAALLDLDAAVANTYADLADAQRHVARADAMSTLRETALRAADRMKSAGEGNQLDLDAATLDLAAARAEAATARGDLEAARTRLARVLGRRDPSTLVVADDVDRSPAPPASEVDSIVEHDPRVLAARAEVDAARATNEAERRAVMSEITFGIDVERVRRDVPAGAFATMRALTATWNEWEIAAQVSIPLPLFDRNRTARANAHAELVGAEARLATVRADIRVSLLEARARLAAALDAANAVADVPQVIDREVQLLDKTLRAGGLDLVTWAQQAHRLAEVGRTYDATILALHRARAAWLRLGVR